MNDLPERIGQKAPQSLDSNNGKMDTGNRQRGLLTSDGGSQGKSRTMDVIVSQPKHSERIMEKASGGAVMSVKEKPQKAKKCDTLLDLVRTLEPQAFYKKRLPYKNWTLLVFKRNDKFTLKIIARREKATFTKLSLDFNDIRYMLQLLKDVKDTFKKLGIEPEQI